MVPTQRSGDWVTSSVGDDTLIYDRTTNELHTLKANHLAVWNACTGRHSTSDIARLTRLDAGIVEHCLAHLSTARLLDSPLPGVSRRKLLGTAGAVAGIVSISAPMAAMAGSTPCATCASVDCNLTRCDETGCYYTPDVGAAGQRCNGGAGTCDNAGNCNTPCICPPRECNRVSACFPTSCEYTANFDEIDKPCNGGTGTCDVFGDCS